MSSKGYLIVETRITDPVAYDRYKLLAQDAIAQFGGRYLVRGGAAEILEGEWKRVPRLVVVEFESVEQTRAFYHSAAYGAAREARAGAAEVNMLIVSGVDNPL